MENMSQKGMIAAAAVAFLLPSAASADIIINEIAWMGSERSGYDEWIKLRNTGADAVDLSGWSLSAVDGSPSIELSGSIGGGEYFLLERTDDDSAFGVPADGIYSGGLSNSGELLQVVDESGMTVDVVDTSSGWSAGDNDLRYTMQRNGGEWISAAGTPRAENATEDMTPAEEEEEAPADESSDDADANEERNQQQSASPTSERETISVHVDPTEMTDFEKAPEIVADAGRDRATAVGVEISMTGYAESVGGQRQGGARYRWTLGDGTTDRGRTVRHTYDYPGEYNVVLNVTNRGE